MYLTPESRKAEVGVDSGAIPTLKIPVGVVIRHLRSDGTVHNDKQIPKVQARTGDTPSCAHRLQKSSGTTIKLRKSDQKLRKPDQKLRKSDPKSATDASEKAEDKMYSDQEQCKNESPRWLSVSDM